MVTYDGVDTAELAGRLRTPSCLILASVTSTLDVIHQLAAEGAPAGTLVVAEEQVVGRGRFGRRWWSPAGAGIWLGYLVRPTRPLEGGVLSIRVGLALARTLSEMGVEVHLKWPNDLILRGRKLGGVLCEARRLGDSVDWIALGIGVNVFGRPPAEVADRAASLEEALPGVSRLAVLERLMPKLHRMSDAPFLDTSERALYEERHWLAGRGLREPASGVARGIDRDGALLVETEDGIERIVGGTVVAA